MWILLFIASILLSVALVPVGILYGIYKSFVKSRLRNGLSYANQKFKRLAVGIDIWGNVACPELFNDLLIKPESSYKFGEYGQTISLVLGYNKKHGTLKYYGQKVVETLDQLDADHCLKTVAFYEANGGKLRHL